MGFEYEYFPGPPACPICGARMYEDEENGVDVYACSDCECVIPQDEFDGDYYPPDDEDDVPPGCRACGCPAYPKCKTSCKLFDD